MLVCLPLVLSSPKVMPVSAAENEEDIPITILNYHKVDNMNIALSVLPEDFDRQMAYLKENGYIRRIGPFFDSGKLEYKGTLVALKVKEGYMQQVAEFINRYPGATHNYEREGEYNLWFTLLTHSEEKRKQILDEIKAQEGVEKLMNLVYNKKYKINVQFKLK